MYRPGPIDVEASVNCDDGIVLNARQKRYLALRITAKESRDDCLYVPGLMFRNRRCSVQHCRKSDWCRADSRASAVNTGDTPVSCFTEFSVCRELLTVFQSVILDFCFIDD